MRNDYVQNRARNYDNSRGKSGWILAGFLGLALGGVAVNELVKYITDSPTKIYSEFSAEQKRLLEARAKEQAAIGDKIPFCP